MLNLNSKSYLVVAVAVVSQFLIPITVDAGCSRNSYSYARPQQYQQITQPTTPHSTHLTSKTSVTNTSITNINAVIVTPKPNNVEVPMGSSMRIKVNFLGEEPGYVYLKSGELVLECPILTWTSSYVEFALPALGILKPTDARIDVAKAEGRVARSVTVTLIPTEDVEVLEPAEVIPRAPRTINANRPILDTGGLPVR